MIWRDKSKLVTYETAKIVELFTLAHFLGSIDFPHYASKVSVSLNIFDIKTLSGAERHYNIRHLDLLILHYRLYVFLRERLFCFTVNVHLTGRDRGFALYDRRHNHSFGLHRVLRSLPRDLQARAGCQVDSPMQGAGDTCFHDFWVSLHLIHQFST